MNRRSLGSAFSPKKEGAVSVLAPFLCLSLFVPAAASADELREETLLASRTPLASLRVFNSSRT
jgi:hypothetical protein